MFVYGGIRGIPLLRAPKGILVPARNVVPVLVSRLGVFSPLSPPSSAFACTRQKILGTALGGMTLSVRCPRADKCHKCDMDIGLDNCHNAELWRNDELSNIAHYSAFILRANENYFCLVEIAFLISLCLSANKCINCVHFTKPNQKLYNCIERW